MGDWQPIETCPPWRIHRAVLCRNENHWPEVCAIKDGMAFDHRGLAMVGYVAVEWHSGVGVLNWLNCPMPDDWPTDPPQDTDTQEQDDGP